jgi:hypothetical protein
MIRKKERYKIWKQQRHHLYRHFDKERTRSSSTRRMSVVGVTAELICSQRVFPVLTHFGNRGEYAVSPLLAFLALSLRYRLDNRGFEDRLSD